jgi:hypothetical protein
MIITIQLESKTMAGGDQRMLVFDANEQLQYAGTASEEILNLLGNRRSAHYAARVNDGGIEIIDELSDHWVHFQ